MIQVTHLLDDFAMGGVTRALTLFEELALKRIANSRVQPVDLSASLAPKVSADLIVDHMALSWKRLAFLACLRARNPRARIVHVEHSYTRGFEAENVTSMARFRTMLKIASLLVDEVVCVSNAQRHWLTNTVGIAAEKLSTIYPWTDCNELFSIPSAKRRAGMAIRLLAFGRYAQAKNFLALIEAMRLLPEGLVQLTVFGDGPDRAKLEAKASTLSNVEVHGPTSSPTEYLAQCDAVIIPSLYEAFGLVATEARMASRAILVADVDGLPEQVGECGLVAQMGDAREIADVIVSAASLDLPRLGKNGRDEVTGQSAGIISGWTKLIERTLIKRTLG